MNRPFTIACTGIPGFILRLSLFFFIPVSGIANQQAILQQMITLEDDFRHVSQQFYESTRHTSSDLKQADINLLAQSINKLQSAHQDILAIQQLYINQDTLLNQIDSPHIFTFLELLLSNNEWHLASELYEALENEGDRTLLASARFQFAKYHARRHEWKQVHELLDGSINELSAENAAYAYLLNGSALQHLKQHRESIESFNRIPAESKYYSYAKLNTAIASIRQGWWTDARNTIDQYLDQTGQDNRDEMTNRLYLVLGYSLLQQEFYRDARNAFREIALDSQYTNRALLGIGLTATSQGDYVGGLNALTLLKQKQTFDLSVDESYLLVPYVYDKLKQALTVSASYTEAMNYYQQRIATLEKLASSGISFSDIAYDPEHSSIILQNNSLDYGQHFPESFIRNYQLLLSFDRMTETGNMKQSVRRSLEAHDRVFQSVVQTLLALREDYLKSYLNQSRYGLARLYDSSQKTGAVNE